MVSFNCGACNDVIKKPKLDAHKSRCAGALFSCIDCSATFMGTDYRAHTSCISEDQKYQGALYRPDKRKGKNGKTTAINNDSVEKADPSASTGEAVRSPPNAEITAANSSHAPVDTAQAKKKKKKQKKTIATKDQSASTGSSAVEGIADDSGDVEMGHAVTTDEVGKHIKAKKAKRMTTKEQAVPAGSSSAEDIADESGNVEMDHAVTTDKASTNKKTKKEKKRMTTKEQTAPAGSSSVEDIADESGNVEMDHAVTADKASTNKKAKKEKTKTKKDQPLADTNTTAIEEEPALVADTKKRKLATDLTPEGDIKKPKKPKNSPAAIALGNTFLSNLKPGRPLTMTKALAHLRNDQGGELDTDALFGALQLRLAKDGTLTIGVVGAAKNVKEMSAKGR